MPLFKLPKGVSQFWEFMASELMIFYRVAVESHSPGLASVGSPTLGISAKARTLKEFYSALPLPKLRRTREQRAPVRPFAFNRASRLPDRRPATEGPYVASWPWPGAEELADLISAVDFRTGCCYFAMQSGLVFQLPGKARWNFAKR